jgi:hypothetical protein
MLTPADPEYYKGTLRYDNILIGEYVQSNGAQNFAQGSPMVHIRAIPEGGTAASRSSDPLRHSVNFPRTFYSRYQTSLSKVTDARQPLPSAFAARWLSGGTGDFQTSLKIWREGGPAAGCAPRAERTPDVADLVTFDENENALGLEPRNCGPIGAACPAFRTELPLTGRYRHTRQDSPFPYLSDAPGGWMYLNLDDPEREGAQQGWVISSLQAEGRYSTDLDATALGNGCSPAPAESEASTNYFGRKGIVIGPAPDATP